MKTGVQAGVQVPKLNLPLSNNSAQMLSAPELGKSLVLFFLPWEMHARLFDANNASEREI